MIKKNIWSKWFINKRNKYWLRTVLFGHLHVAFVSVEVIPHFLFHAVGFLLVFSHFFVCFCHVMHVRIREGGRGSGTPLKNVKNIGFFSHTGPDPLLNHTATKQTFNVGPPAFRWRADDGPLILVFESSLLSSTKDIQ